MTGRGAPTRHPQPNTPTPKREKMMAGRKPTPEEAPTPDKLADEHNLPALRVLIDFDITTSVKQVIGGDPVDLTHIPTVPVRSLINGEAIITIIAHANEEQEVADLLAQKPFWVQTAFAYAMDYFKQGVTDVALNALTEEQIRTLEDHSGKDMSEFS